MNKRKLFKGKRVLLEDGLQEAGILVGDKGKIEKILRKDELETLQHDVEVSRKNNYVIPKVLSEYCSQNVVRSLFSIIIRNVGL